MFKFDREKAESDLNFLGFVLLYNRVKDSTIDTIIKLNFASINIHMATGDHIDTAIAIGKECNFYNDNDCIFIVNFDEDDKLLFASDN